jgi:hypothetical protein
MQVAATTPQKAGWLFAVCPDVPKLLAVVALREPIFCFVCLSFYCNRAQAV